MIVCDSELSNQMIMHPWINGYYTWDDIKYFRKQLENEHKKYVIKNWMLTLVIPFIIAYALLMSWAGIRFPGFKPYNYLCFSLLASPLFWWFFITVEDPQLNRWYHKHKIKTFKEYYGKDFNLNYGFWKKVKE